MYYKDGWNAYVDGKLSSHFRANYALRAMNIPAGNHKIEFKFEPQVVETGSMIALISSIGMLLVIAAGIYFARKKV
jgi:LPXTG-motif cell wall-anchored protein